MVKTELSYNPYLKKTEIKFNGKLPRINSLVEKYQNEMLISWMHRVPKIFYDEMNGYDFELDFTGTELDLEELKHVFLDAGVSEELVQIFHKNELEDRLKKLDRIEALLKWMDENPNRRFDKEKFRQQNTELFDSDYPFIFIQGDKVDASVFDDLDISVEFVNDVKELENTVLMNTPILFFLDQETLSTFPKNLQWVLGRPNVHVNQLFFLIDDSLDAEQAQRIICDLGVANPQIVESAYDSSVRKYLQLYPFTDYIQKTIDVLEKQKDVLARTLQEENERSERENKEIRIQIRQIEYRIIGIKKAIDNITNKDNLVIPNEWKTFKYDIQDSITFWRQNKTKTQNGYEATSLAKELVEAANIWFDEFTERLDAAFTIQLESLREQFESWYRETMEDPDFIPVSVDYPTISEKDLPPFYSNIMDMKKEEYVVPKEQGLGKFFKSAGNEQKDLTLVTTYFYQDWKNYIIEMITPIVDAMINERYLAACSYSDQMEKVFLEHLKELLSLRLEEKNQVASQLSEDEQLLQADNDWLATLIDQITAIERD